MEGQELLNGIIYKIYLESDRKTVYIGSSFHTKEYRFNKHKYNYRSYLKGKYDYVTSFELVKYPDAKIDLIKDVKVKNKTELRQIENDFITIYDDLGFTVVNKNKAFRTQQDKQKQNVIKSTKYNQQHREEIREKQKEKFICKCGGRYTRSTSGSDSFSSISGCSTF